MLYENRQQLIENSQTDELMKLFNVGDANLDSETPMLIDCFLKTCFLTYLKKHVKKQKMHDKDFGK